RAMGRTAFHLPSATSVAQFVAETFLNPARKFAAQQLLRADMKNWRTKLISILRTKLTLENWRAKLISLLLATMLWYLIKKNLTTTSSPSEGASPAPVTETH